MRVWVDIDNPPQVQYLVPVGQAFDRAGADVVYTARDHGITFDLLRARSTPFHPVGSRFEKSKISKIRGLLRRTQALTRIIDSLGRPDVLISASRSSAAAARRLAIPSFIIVDYEFVHLGLYRLLDARLLFPEVIDRAVLRKRGFRDSQLVSFRGLKEDLTFFDVVFDEVAPHEFPQIDSDKDLPVRVLFRPPADESHYHSSQSTALARALLCVLAEDARAIVIFSPRYRWQLDYLSGLRWINDPIPLQEAVPFLSLLKAVDLVVSGGGTMLREAAYVGVPAYSTFRGAVGAVDRYLETIGRLHPLASPADFAKIAMARGRRLPLLRSNRNLPGEIVEIVTTRVSQ